MLLIYLQDSNKESLETMVEYCRNKLPFSWETRVAACVDCPDKILNKPGSGNIPALFIMEESDNIVFQIREDNYLHYLILLLNSLEDSLKVRPPYYRPSGFLLSPVQGDKILDLLESIYQDFKAGQSGNEICQIKINATVYPVPYSNIILFESAQKKIIARTKSQEYEFYASLEQCHEQAPTYFIRVHRGFCVNLNEIASVHFQEKYLEMRDGAVVPISRSYRAILEESLKAMERGKG